MVMFSQGYLEWWLDSNLLFTQYILNTISTVHVYVLSERWLTHMNGMLFIPTNKLCGWSVYKHLCQLYNSEVYITEDSIGKSCYETQ